MRLEGQHRPRLRTAWLDTVSKELSQGEGIPAVIRRRGALSNWSKLRSAPSGRLETELSYALQIAIGNYDHPLVHTCQQRALEVIEAGTHDERWGTWWAATRTIEHGRFLSAAHIAEAWVKDANLDASCLSAASEEIVRGAREERPVWTEMAQSEYVHGVQLLILAERLDEATQAIAKAKPFTRVRRYHDWHARLLQMLAEDKTDETTMMIVFDEYFDQIRDPAFRSLPDELTGDSVPDIGLARLRLALIRWIYIERQPVAGNWRHIIGQIGY